MQQNMKMGGGEGEGSSSDGHMAKMAGRRSYEWRCVAGMAGRSYPSERQHAREKLGQRSSSNQRWLRREARWSNGGAGTGTGRCGKVWAVGGR
jgi:hypothetical protein